MTITTASTEERTVGIGKTQLLCETSFSVKPAMSRVLGELYDVEISDYTVFNDKVLVKGIVEKSFFYKHPHLGKRDGKKDDGKKDDDKKDDDKKDDGKKGDGKRDDEKRDDKKDDKRDDRKGDDGKRRGDKKEEDRKGDADKADEKKVDRVKDVSNEFIKWLFQLNLNEQASSDENKQETKQESEIDLLKYCGFSDNLKYSGFSGDRAEDGTKYMTGWCSRIDEHDGIVHFYQETLEFAGVMEIPGIMPGDTCHVESAGVRSYDSVKATEKNDDGLVNAGRQIFLVEIAMKVTRKDNKRTIEKQDDFEKAILQKPILVKSWDAK